MCVRWGLIRGDKSEVGPHYVTMGVTIYDIHYTIMLPTRVNLDGGHLHCDDYIV
jgi:hypothetical protein